VNNSVKKMSEHSCVKLLDIRHKVIIQLAVHLTLAKLYYNMEGNGVDSGQYLHPSPHATSNFWPGGKAA
jgi:hypothetical protein